MSRFKVGDKVQIKSCLELNNKYGICHFVKGMELYRGLVATVTRVHDNDTYDLNIDNNHYYWSEEMLLPYRLEVRESQPQTLTELEEFIAKFCRDFDVERDKTQLYELEFLNDLMDACIDHKVARLTREED